MTGRLPVAAFIAAAVASSVAGGARGLEVSGQLALEARAFPQGAAYEGQEDSNVSLALQPEIYHDWLRGDLSVTISPFVRVDHRDDERTHGDLREAFVLYVHGPLELRAGLRSVFWGVTESQHLVDVINQTDLVENVDGEDKLGQPMVDLTWIHDLATLELFLMSGFRARTFPGEAGRPRLPLEVTGAEYESSSEEGHVDVAARVNRTIGAWDVAVSHFAGTSREPTLLPRVRDGVPVLVPHYELIHQSGLELQAVTGGWLWKLEGVHRSGQGPTFNAGVAGFEYTFVGLLGTIYDVGMIGEYHGDDRGEEATSPFQNDVFVGARVVLNDVQSTEILLGGIHDLDHGSTLLNLEASRRLGESWRLYVEYRGFTGAPPEDPFHAFRRDDYLQLELARFF